MFTSLKNKIKEENGTNVVTANGVVAQHRPINHNNNNRIRSRFSSSLSVSSTADDGDGSLIGINTAQQATEQLRSQCNELTTKVANLMARINVLQEEKTRTEKTNEILLETVKVAQTQKDIYCEEQEKIHNLQLKEIEKMKNLLSFRDQEAVNQLNSLRQNQQQIESLTFELERLKKYEAIVDDLQDELESLRHSSQVEQNSLTSNLAAVKEENHHLKKRLEIVEQSRVDVINSLKTDERVQALVQERKLLEQHLEEAHLQLSDIKSSWSGQNLALETQVSRLSKQVAEETTEKRRALKALDDLKEKVKQLEFEKENLNDQIKQRNDKIKLLEEEIDELNHSLKECREEKDQKVIYERNKAETFFTENTTLKTRLEAAEQRFTEHVENSDLIAQTLRQQNAALKEKLGDLQNKLETEKEENLTAILKNAEISQNEEILKKELRIERDEANDLHEKNLKLEADINEKHREITDCKLAIESLKTSLQQNENQLKKFNDMQSEICEKNKTIKTLQQRLNDLKKTLQKEFRSTVLIDTNSNAEQNCRNTQLLPPSATTKTTVKNTCCNCDMDNTCFVMDEVNFAYLKHVLVKFLTSREAEARHLIRAVATVLRLSNEEEKLLHDTLNWKMSWFGTRPNTSIGTRGALIPPS